MIINSKDPKSTYMEVDVDYLPWRECNKDVDEHGKVTMVIDGTHVSNLW